MCFTATNCGRFASNKQSADWTRAERSGEGKYLHRDPCYELSSATLPASTPFAGLMAGKVWFDQIDCSWLTFRVEPHRPAQVYHSHQAKCRPVLYRECRNQPPAHLLGIAWFCCIRRCATSTPKPSSPRKILPIHAISIRLHCTRVLTGEYSCSLHDVSSLHRAVLPLRGRRRNDGRAVHTFVPSALCRGQHPVSQRDRCDSRNPGGCTSTRAVLPSSIISIASARTSGVADATRIPRFHLFARNKHRGWRWIIFT